MILTAVALLALPAGAFAAESPVAPKKCCCDKMEKAEGKECCADEKSTDQDPHAGHKMDAPKS